MSTTEATTTTTTTTEDVKRVTRQGEKFTSDPSFHKSDFSYSYLKQLVENTLLNTTTTTNDDVVDSRDNNNNIDDNTSENVVMTCSEDKSWLNKSESEAWEHVYQQHSNKIFPIKNYICKCFPELDSTNNISDAEETLLLECGCGTGSCLLPLVLRNQKWKFVACDYSSHAVETLKKHEIYERNCDRIDAFVWDVCDSHNERIVSSYLSRADKILLIFVLSAMSSIDKMYLALRNIWKVLKPGGILLFRDYGKYDMAHTRFLRKLSKRGSIDSFSIISDSDRTIFRRDDGTFSFFFSQEFCQELFTSCGFKILELEYHCVMLRNKKIELDMFRVFINGRFEKVE